jgi:hypothetical protein
LIAAGGRDGISPCPSRTGEEVLGSDELHLDAVPGGKGAGGGASRLPFDLECLLSIQNDMSFC